MKLPPGLTGRKVTPCQSFHGRSRSACWRVPNLKPGSLSCRAWSYTSRRARTAGHGGGVDGRGGSSQPQVSKQTRKAGSGMPCNTMRVAAHHHELQTRVTCRPGYGQPLSIPTAQLTSPPGTLGTTGARTMHSPYRPASLAMPVAAGQHSKQGIDTPLLHCAGRAWRWQVCPVSSGRSSHLPRQRGITGCACCCCCCCCCCGSAGNAAGGRTFAAASSSPLTADVGQRILPLLGCGAVHRRVLHLVHPAIQLLRRLLCQLECLLGQRAHEGTGSVVTGIMTCCVESGMPAGGIAKA